MGVGNSDASIISSTMTLITRDLASILGSLLFSYYTSKKLHNDIKSWRLFADVINDIGLTLDMIWFFDSLVAAAR